MWITRHYNADTNVLEWVQYPEDTAETRTEYSYDALYRLATAETMVDSGYSLAVEYGYTDDLLTSIMTNSTTYNFTYGLFAQSAAVKVGSRILASYEYTDNQNRYLQKMTYHNDVADDTVDENDFIQYNYDTQGRLILETYEDGDTVAYTYDNNGALATVTDSATGRKTTYYYDFTDRLMKHTESGTNFYHSVGYEYDSLNNLTSLVEIINGVEHSTTYTYDDDNRVSTSTVSINNGQIVVNTDSDYDSFGRLYTTDVWTALTDGFTKEYRYTGHSTQVNELQVDIEYAMITYLMNYDDNGNITSAVVGDYNSSYAYDSANQLIRENNSGAGKTWVWAYDDAGNILSRTEYAYTTGVLDDPIDTVLYTYGNTEWGDLLTAYDGVALTYDGIGNLTDDGTWEYAWEHGRELASMFDGATTWTYTYDANGMRTSRTNGTTTYNYIYNGSQLVQMTVGNNILQYIYNSMGEPVALLWNGTLYYIVTNLQGDVHLILDTDNEIVVSYEYDAWGNILSTSGSMATTLGALNPLRYRAYVYDQETGLYYLQSRYYNPEWGRFINADTFISTGQGQLGNNIFAYCLNNPVNSLDPLGTWTFGISFGINVSAFLGASIGIGIYWDGDGNMDIQWSYSVPGMDNTASVGLLDAGASIALQYTNADTVYDLYGPATYVGGSGGPWWYVGADLISFEDASDLASDIDGFQIVGGFGVGFDLHVTETYTRKVGNPSSQHTMSGSSNFGLRGGAHEVVDHFYALCIY